VNEESWRSGAGERCRDFAGDVAGFAHASYDDPAFAGHDELHGAMKLFVEPVCKGLHRFCLDVQDIPGKR
jgi:hypothetical protein